LEHDPKAILETRCWRFLWVSEAVMVVETVTIPIKTRKHRHNHHRGHWSTTTPIWPKIMALCTILSERSERKKKNGPFFFIRIWDPRDWQKKKSTLTNKIGIFIFN
jgi:hypothetical protein